MSYLSRILKKQKRITNKLNNAPIMSFSGFGRTEILVFQVYHWVHSDSIWVNEYSHIQSQILNDTYKNLAKFDSYHTPDVEFSHFYKGKNQNRYHRETKKQLIEVGKVWRKRVTEKYPNANINIVVHFEKENDSWFLDTFNWNIIDKWKENEHLTIWL